MRLKLTNRMRRCLREKLHVDLPRSIEIFEGHDLKIGQCSTLRHDLVVADFDTVLGHDSYSNSNLARVVCGNYCSIGEDVIFAPSRHPLTRLTTHLETYSDIAWPYEPAKIQRQPYEDVWAPVEIGHDCWIGSRAIVMGGIHIGTGAVVAANAVVTRDVPPYAIVGGTPACIIRYRFDEETRAALLASNWWEYDLRSWDESVAWNDVHASLRKLQQAIVEKRIRSFPTLTTVDEIAAFVARERKWKPWM